MSIDINKAIKFPFKDNQWLQKLVIGGLFYFAVNAGQGINGFIGYFINPGNLDSDASLIAVAIRAIFSSILLIVSIIASAFPIGYALQSAHNEIKDETPLLPDWDNKFVDYFKQGLNYYLIYFLYLFAICAILAIPLVIGISVFGLYRDIPLISFAGLFFSLLFIVPVIVFYLFISPFIVTSYAENWCLNDAFRLDKIVKAIAKVLPEYFVCTGITILITLILPVLSVMLTCTCIGILAIPFLSLPAILISYNLYSQAYKLSSREI